MHQYHLIPEFLFPLRRALSRGGVALDIAALEAAAEEDGHPDKSWARHALLRTKKLRLSGGRLALAATSAALVDQDAPFVTTEQMRYLRPKEGHSFVRVTVDATPWHVLAALANDLELGRGLLHEDLHQYVAQRLRLPRAVTKLAIYSALFGANPKQSLVAAIEMSSVDISADDVIAQVRNLFASSFRYIDALNAYKPDLGRETVQALANRNAHQMLTAAHDAVTGAHTDVSAALLVGPDAVLYQVPHDQIQVVGAAVDAMRPGVKGAPELGGRPTAMLFPNY